MSNDNMFDILMEIRKVDKQISEIKLQVQKSQQEFITLESRLNHTKELQSKATKVYYEMQKKEEIVKAELEEVHKNYDAVSELLREQIPMKNVGNEEMLMKIEELRKHRDLLKQKLSAAESERGKLLEKMTDIEIQINIQKKKNAATQIRLQKCLQELLLDEKKLEEELKSLRIKNR